MSNHHIVTLLVSMQLCYLGNSCPDGCQCFTPSKVFCSAEHLKNIPRNMSSEVKELVVMTTRVMYVYADTFPPNSSLVKVVLLNNLLWSISEKAFSNLEVLEELEISGNSHLKEVTTETFLRLGRLTKLLLNHNSLSALENGLFDPLRNLEILQLKGNIINHLPGKLFHCLHQLHTLDLSVNNISVVEEDLFDGLTALEKLGLNFNLIGALHPHTFRGLSHLKELGLQGNRITNLHQHLLSSLKHLKTLNLRNNLIATIMPGTFPPSLRELNLGNNKLTQLPSGAFKHLPFLSHLLLSKNQLSALPDDVFRNLTSLEHLDLSENHMSTLPAAAFAGLLRLTVLHLEKNNISDMGAELFKDQSMMERLYLSDNKLANIPEGLLTHVIFLHMAHLHGNPWRCDCELLPLQEWLRDAAVLPTDIANVRCSEPLVFRGQPVVSLSQEQLVCPGKIGTPTTPATALHRQRKEHNCTLQEADGRLSVHCAVLGCPRVKLEFHYFDQNGRMLNVVSEREWSESTQCVNATVILTL